MSETEGQMKGRVAIVTGAASGIGAEVAAQIANEGARVVAADLNEPANLPEDAEFAALDVTDPQAWQKLVADVVARLGRVDILVNCAGILAEGTLWSTTLEDWRRIIAINVEGTFLGCQAVIPHMPAGGSIVNIGSISAWLGDADLLGYTTSKAAVVNLTREIALDCARRGNGVRCNSVSPGTTGTPMVRDFFNAGPRATHDEWIAAHPLGREILPGEVAAVIVFLAGDDASFVTGADYPVDCGALA